ncbi:MAG: hypothetical protein IPK18_10340 [Sphingobacteriales bacterium]|nr:MAG: hypothetical protein IPK18_10340 [Sphingobacteriales bacterium]
MSLLILCSLLQITTSCNKDENNNNKRTLKSHPFMDIENNVGSVNWFDIDGMMCRDGSNTGIGFRVGSKKKLAIYINGGGACFNDATCASNPKSFSEEEWDYLHQEYKHRGIFDASNPKNPIKDFSMVFIPYCTGDVHSGTKTVGFALDVADTQRYVGALNFKKVIDFIEPYYQYNEVEEILLFGMSAGGYGVYVNFLEVVNRFPNAKITVINDSGPLFSDADAFPICLQIGFLYIFGLPVPDDLYDCCGKPAQMLANVYPYSSKKYPNANFGFISSLEDEVSRFFLSFGYNNCSGAPGNQLPADLFRSSLITLRDDVLKPKSTWSTYYIDDNTHTMLGNNELMYNRNKSGMYLYEWIGKVMNGQKMHITESE